MHEVDDVNNDDLSDGISIISESESNGRLSPHPYLRDHLHDLNLKFATAATQDEEDTLYKLKDDTPMHASFPTPVIVPATEEQQIRQRPVRSLARESTQEDDQRKAVQMVASQTAVELCNIPPMVKRGLQGIFYIGIALAILALIGRMRTPSSWDSSSPSSAELQQKVNDMELQNNLMRAEIDLLNKQVKYLSTLNDPQQQQQYHKKMGKNKGHYEEATSYEGKKFKAWSGNGDSLRPVEITKDDLKRPYKCPDGSFREVAGMCMENRPNDPNIVEQFEQVVDDFKQQSETMQAFEKVAQDLHVLTENPFEQVQQILSEQQEPDVKLRQHLDKQSNQFLKNKPIYQAAEDSTQQQQFEANTPSSSVKQGEHRDQRSASERRKEYGKSKERYDIKQGFLESNKPPSYDKKHSKETYDKSKPQNKEGRHYKPPRDGYESDDDDDDSKERFNKRGRNDSRERYQKRGEHENSRERHGHRKRDDDDSKERHNSKRFKENNSKEHFNKDKSPHGSGEWQEQYMKHREDLRKQNENKYSGENKNWFMKRGDGRENKRNNDIRYR